MDRHQAAYWLDRTPAEAADFLARTVVASRLVGGFVKRADAPDWRSALNSVAENAPLKHTLIGAGLGGLGGLGVGMLNRRKKSPWSTALTGAALGGGAGLAYTGVRNYLDDPGSGARVPAALAMDRTDAASVRGADPVSNALAKATREAARVNGIEPTPGADPGAELDRISPGDLARQGLRDMPVVGGAFTNPLYNAGVAGLAGVAEGGVRGLAGRAALLGNFERGLPGVGKGAVENDLRNVWNEATLLAGKHTNPITRWIGRIPAGNYLNRMAQTPGTLPTPPTTGVAIRAAQGSHVNQAINAGRVPGRGGFLRGALPTLATQLGAQAIFGNHDVDEGQRRFAGGLFGGRASPP
jgi:hypothetical protein